MRILHIDIDTLRPDHLSCYGYHRKTSPNIDRIAEKGIRFDHCYASDTPCLPSRAAFFMGRHGIHTGIVNHGGVCADRILRGPDRGFRDQYDSGCFLSLLRRAGLWTASVSPFAERHSGWWFCAGFNETYNTGGGGGSETADVIAAPAADWLQRNAKNDNWYLHVNFWDPHTSYRTPEEYGNPFKDDPPPQWLDEETIQRHRTGAGPHSALNPQGYNHRKNPRERKSIPTEIKNVEDFKNWIDGYDVGIHYADHYVGKLLDLLEKNGVLDETAIIVSSDHGENQGELNVYGDHQTADIICPRVPFILRWPGITEARVDDGLHYQGDLAATIVELLAGSGDKQKPARGGGVYGGGQSVAIPDFWDWESFAAQVRENKTYSRDSLVLSHAVWSCQRSARWGDWILIRTYHTGLKQFPEVMLFNVKEDFHETTNLALKRPDLVQQGLTILQDWYDRMMASSPHKTDPLWQVINEGGPFHAKEGQHLEPYLQFLRENGWESRAEEMEKQGAKPYPRDVETPVARLAR